MLRIHKNLPRIFVDAPLSPNGALALGREQSNRCSPTTPKRLKHERLRANAIKAAEQCEMLWVPSIGPDITLSQLLDLRTAPGVC